MFNNKTFLALSENLPQRIFNKDKKHKKQKAATLKKILKTIFSKSFPARIVKLKVFHEMEKHKNCKVFNQVLPNAKLYLDLASSIKFQNDKRKV